MKPLHRSLLRSPSTLLLLAAILLFFAQYALASPARSARAPSHESPGPADLPMQAGPRGRSGALRAVVVPPGQPLGALLFLREGLGRTMLRWVPVVTGPGVPPPLTTEGLKAPEQPGIWRLAPDNGLEPEAVPVILTPTVFDGSSTHLNGYHLGRYPARAARLTGRYTPPRHFLEVTSANQDFAVSEHFRLRHFLTKDQTDVWPKYLALSLRLVDKLELLIQELRAMGFPARRLHVMSGFRTPQYNGPGGRGRARFSRHTYGDAADVWLDDDGDGQMDDLDGNGRIDVRDAEVLARAIERVERRAPELVGGHGVYRANRLHGPFVHIDVRGTPARWGRR